MDYQYNPAIPPPTGCILQKKLEIHLVPREKCILNKNRAVSDLSCGLYGTML